VSNPVLTYYPNPRLNAFVMMRFTDSVNQRAIYSALSTCLGYYGINALRADQRSYAESLWENVRWHIDACNYGVAVFEQLEHTDYNPNVSLELGIMLAQRKQVLLLKENTLPRLPTDILGHLYRPFQGGWLCVGCPEGCLRLGFCLHIAA
jgi:hypothetical protein